MEENKDNSKITRKRFLNVCGSLVAAGGIIGVSGTLVHKMVSLPEQSGSKLSPTWKRKEGRTDSPYRRVAAFRAEGEILGFALLGDSLVVATPGRVDIYDRVGNPKGGFAVNGTIRDITVYADMIYLLQPTAIQVYDNQGKLSREWEACSEESDYCSIAVAKEQVYVTDAANKNICQYSADGNFKRFIQSPNGFVIPSYTFGITVMNDRLYCANSGRHQVESYTLDGEYIEAFGKPGGADGLFCGCCNPAFVEPTPAGELITSEKGKPRISCYTTDGTLRAVLLDGPAMGGGNKAYRVKLSAGDLFIAGKEQVSLFKYDKAVAATTACGSCDLDCPLKAGVEDLLS